MIIFKQCKYCKNKSFVILKVSGILNVEETRKKLRRSFIERSLHFWNKIKIKLYKVSVHSRMMTRYNIIVKCYSIQIINW